MAGTRHADDSSRRRVESYLRALGRRPTTLSGPARVTTVEVSSPLPLPARDIIALCLRRENFTAIMPDPMQVVRASSAVGELGGLYHFRWRPYRTVPLTWVAYIDSVTPGRQFTDLQAAGPFRYFHHTHTAVDTETGCVYTDTIRFAGPAGRWVDDKLLRPRIAALFRVRHRRMRALAVGTSGQAE